MAGADPKTETAAIEPPYDFSAQARHDATKLTALLADTHARLRDGRWEEHLARLQPGLKAALAEIKADPDGKAANELAKDPLFATAAGQALLIAQTTSTDGFVARTGPESLRKLTQTEGLIEFLEDLLAKPTAMQLFLAQAKPDDDVPAALRTWSLVWNAEPLPLRGKYLNLQIACALVFDRDWPIVNETTENVNPAKRYAFFRDAAEAGNLKTDVTRLSPGMLVWVVGTDIGDTDLHWAHQEGKLRHLPAADWAKAYEIVYNGGTMAKEITPKNRSAGQSGENPLTRTQQEKLNDVDPGSLEQMFKFGGDAAVFAVESARTFGIPAAKLTGQPAGPKPAPTWAAFQRDLRHWELGVGRPHHGAPVGTAIDPQTLQPMRDFELATLAEKKLDTTEAERCLRLRLLARLAAQAGETGRQQAFLAAACRTMPRSLPAWRERLTALAAPTVAPTAPWNDTLRELRQAFEGDPDMGDLADEYEVRFILARLPAAEAVRAIQGHLRKLRRDHPDRKDLLLAGVSRAARLLARDRNANAANLSTLYRWALDECATDMTEFRGVLADYYATVKGEEKLELRFLDDMEHAFRRKVDLPPLEFFDMTEDIYVYFRKCGQGLRGLRLRKEGEKAKEEALKEIK